MIDRYLKPLTCTGKAYFWFLVKAVTQYLLYLLIRSLWFIPWIFEGIHLVRIEGIYLDHLLGQLVGVGMISIIIDLILHDITIEKVTGYLRVKMDRVKIFKGDLKGFHVRIALSEGIKKKDSPEGKEYMLIVDDGGKEPTFVNYRVKNKLFPETLKSDIEQYCDIFVTDIPKSAPDIGYTYIPEMDTIIMHPSDTTPTEVHERIMECAKEADEILRKGK